MGNSCSCTEQVEPSQFGLKIKYNKPKILFPQKTASTFQNSYEEVVAAEPEEEKKPTPQSPEKMSKNFLEVHRDTIQMNNQVAYESKQNNPFKPSHR